MLTLIVNPLFAGLHYHLYKKTNETIHAGMVGFHLAFTMVGLVMMVMK